MPKPLLFTDTRTPEEKFDPSVIENADTSAVPGYSNIVRANDIAKADDLTFREQHRAALKPNGKQGLTKEDLYAQFGTGPKEIPIELSWERVVGPGGAHSYAADKQFAAAKAEGWEPITPDVLKEHGFGFPPTGHLESDGLIHRNDTVLCYRSGKLGRRWAEYRQHKAIEAEGSASTPSEFAAGDYTVAARGEVIERSQQEFTH